MKDLHFSDNFRDVYWNIARRAVGTRFTIFGRGSHNTFNIAFTKYRLKIASVLLLHNLFIYWLNSC